MILGVLSDFQKVTRTVGYQTAWDSSVSKFRIVGPDGMVPGRSFTSRIGAFNAAVAMARLTFAEQDSGNMLKKAKAVFTNDMIEEFGEENLLDGPLYHPEVPYEEAD